MMCSNPRAAEKRKPDPRNRKKWFSWSFRVFQVNANRPKATATVAISAIAWKRG
jgi:hypothetical protein